jgi:hypothetical protein
MTRQTANELVKAMPLIPAEFTGLVLGHFHLLRDLRTYIGMNGRRCSGPD